MGTFKSFRRAYGALKDSTKVGLAKVNSEYKELDVAIVKATSHVEYPPKERHIRKIFYATAAHQPRADVAYCIHQLAKRLSKTRNWIVAIKTLIVIHRILREGDPTFKEDLLNYSRRGNVLQISNFRDNSTTLAWDCSAWVRSYAKFLEERLECFRILKYDIESERSTKSPSSETKGHRRTLSLTNDELLEQLPALQQVLQCLTGCQPEGAAYNNYLVQYALALVLKESFKIYCALNDGIINLVDMVFDMSKHDAVKALQIYKRAGLQAENLSVFYEYCKGMDLARSFQFPNLRQPPPSFMATIEEYIKEAPPSGSVRKRLEHEENDESPKKKEVPEPDPEPKEDEEPPEEEAKEEEPETQSKEEEAEPPLISMDDLLGLNEIDPKAQEVEESNALALAIVQPGGNNSSDIASTNISGTSGWELALVTAPSNHSSQALDRKLGGGFDKLLLDSLYEDENARRQLQLQNAGYYGGMAAIHNPYNYNQPGPFAISNNIAPQNNMQMGYMTQQQQQQIMFQQQQMALHQKTMMMVPYQYSYNQQQHPQQMQVMGSSNPFGDPLPVSSHPHSSTPHHWNYNLL